jgi:hypothetical protein
MLCFEQLSVCSSLTGGECGTRSSRSPERERAGGEQEGKRDLKALHSTFAKAEGETVLPDKAEHLILPPQRVDTAFPHPASERYCHAVYHPVSAKQDLLGRSFVWLTPATLSSSPAFPCIYVVPYLVFPVLCWYTL